MKTSLWRGSRLLSPVLVLACEAVCAQAVPPSGLEPVVVTATRTATPLRDVLSDVTVIERDELQRRGTAGVADVLRSVPGFEMVRTGGPGATTTMYVRGGETRFTAVLVDGVRVDTQTTGGASWESIPLSQIDRIEVVRGPASSVYGSDAVAGVVQIFTRKGEQGTRFELGVLAGAQATLNTDVGVSGAVGGFDYAVSALSQYSDGHNSRATGNPDRDGHRAHGGSARAGLKLGNAHRVEISLLRNRLDAQYDGFTPTADEHALHALDTARAAWTAQWSRAWSSAVTVGQSSYRYETRPDPYTTRTRIRTAAWQNDLRLGAHTVNATLEHREDGLQNSSLLGAADRSTGQNALALGYGWRQGMLGVQANVRHDKFREFGSVNTGSIGLGVDVARGWRLQSSVGNAFRAPTLYQRYTEYGPTAQELRPERSRSNVELALHHASGSFKSSVTAYRNRITDLIQYVNAPPPPAVGPCPSAWGCYENVGNALLQGVTLATHHEADGWRIGASLDLQSPKNLDTGKLLARRSRQHGALNVARELGDTTLGMQWIAVGQRYEDAANSVKLGTYSVCNVDVSHKVSRSVRLLGRIENVFDRKYENPRTYNAVPMSAFVGLRWTPEL